MSSAYASPPHSTRASTPRSPPAHSRASTSKSTIETSMQALSPPPPTLREILSAYASKGQGDRTMLIALLNAKAAEEQRIAAVATLQQNVLQMQMSIVAAQLQVQSRSRVQPREEPELRSPVSPSPRSRRAASPRGLREMSPLMSGRREKSHPYAAARPVKREEELSWAPRRSWDSVSDERSTSEDCASGRE